ncbi:unnamed protein product [Didymodactylos carnosus]|uniref:Retrotransposon gag domain-containing protein n=1 Tax=Didymodactylos carnosus TaxID=1234261 RepID=A0A8S2LEP9_9BILA|nr:unnamed protein product [Didymodactylos carnosus]CAF3898518.1 unnamed protein product [Didymodactylos carnosus]
MKLGGEAKIWFQNNRSVLETWPALKDGLKQTFSSSWQSDAIFKKLNDRRQAIDESVLKYVNNVIQLCHQVNPQMDKNTVMKYLKAGLKQQSLQAFVALKEPNTPQEFLRAAQEAELYPSGGQDENTSFIQSQNVIASSTSQSSRQQYSSRFPHYYPAQSSQEFQQQPQPNVIPQQMPRQRFTNRNTTPRQCYNCQQWGHISRESSTTTAAFSVTGLSDGDNPKVPINPSSSVYVNLLVNNHPTKILVDTGASNTFVSTLLLGKLHHKPINKQKSTYVLADGGARLQVMDTVELQIKVKNILTTVTALVTSS